jgi:PAS domain S-box-containing protein
MDFSWWMKFVHPDDRSIRQASADELQHQEASTCTYRLVDQHGQTHWMRELIRVDRNADGVPIRRVGVATDITPLKKAEIALNRERNLLRTLIDNIPDYIYIKDLALTHVLNNRANLTLLGAESEKETLGKTLIDYFGPEVAPYLVDDQRVINTGEPLINQEEKLQSEALGERLLLTTKVPLRDDAGNITGVIGISRDITEHRRQEVTLRRYQENLGIIFSSTREDILLLDHEGKVVLFNAAQERFLLNATGKQIQEGQYLWDVTLPERKAAARALFDEVVTRQLPLVTQSTAVVDGDLVAQELRYEPIRVDGVVKYVSVISIDITERKLHEIEMHKSQHLLIKAYEIAKIGYWTYDTGADHAEWNEQTRKIFGVSSAYQPALQSYLALVYPGDQQRVEEEAIKAINNGELFNVEHRIIRKDDGSLRWVHVRADFIQQENEDRLMLGVIQDISERKTFEEVLLEYNQRYEILSRATNDAIWDRDIERDSEVWNHGIETIFGYADRQISTAKEWWKEKIHPEDFERVNLEIGQAFAQLRTNWISQYRYRCADQTYKYVLNRAYIIYQDEHPVRMIGSMQDITSQKEFERNITAIARELSELIQHANAPIFGADRNGYINEWNRVTEELTGYSKNEMLGKSIGLCIREDHRQEFMLLLQRVFKGSPLDNLQLPMMSKEQRDLIFLLNTTPRRNSEQQITGVLMVGQNITELIEYRVNLEAKVQERTRELNEALRKEKELVEMKSRFVSIASHEFRTPLSTIALATGFLRKHREKISPDDFVKKLATIEKQVDHMTYLLDDILMIGKSEAGKIKTKYTQVDIETFFQQTAREVEESMRTHQVQTFIQCSVKSFTADEKLLRNILINLITNAIKFSPDQKSVMLRVTNSPDYLKLEVKDKGIGITPEDQQNVFSAFHRGANVGAIQGTGLGLSIVKKAVDLLAGQIHLSSQAGEGTLFTITLPLRV